MSEKYAIMSLSVKPEMQDLLKSAAKKMGWSVSELIRTLVNRHLGLIVTDGAEIPVILKVPAELKGNEAELRKWLGIRTEAIVKKLADNSVPATTP